MTKLLHKIIFWIVLVVCYNPDIVFAQANTEQYSSKIVLDLKWGDAPEEIGYLNYPNYEYEGHEHAGPSAFDVDENGNIYILDTVHNYIKAFDQYGDLSQSFPVYDAGGNFGYIDLDVNNNIWHHNTYTHTFRQYAPNGMLIKSIEYPENQPIPSEFGVRDGEIFGYNVKIEVTGLSSKSGIKGEPVYDAVPQMLGRNEPSIANAGTFSKRLFNNIYSDFSPNDGLSKPKIEIIEEDSSLINDPYTMTIKDETIIQVLNYLSLASPISWEKVHSQKLTNGELSGTKYIIRYKDLLSEQNLSNY